MFRELRQFLFYSLPNFTTLFPSCISRESMSARCWLRVTIVDGSANSLFDVGQQHPGEHISCRDMPIICWLICSAIVIPSGIQGNIWLFNFNIARCLDGILRLSTWITCGSLCRYLRHSFRAGLIGDLFGLVLQAVWFLTRFYPASHLLFSRYTFSWPVSRLSDSMPIRWRWCRQNQI